MPGFISRVKSTHGSLAPPTITVPTAATDDLDLPQHSNVFLVTAPSNITGMSTCNLNKPIETGRIVLLIAADSTANLVFTNDDTPTSKGQMDLGGSDITLDDRDVLCLIQRSDGSWLRIFNTNN